MVFERYNKKIKNMVGNKKYPISSLTNALVRDAAAMYHRWTFETSYSQVENNLSGGARIFGAGKIFIPTVKLTNQLVLCTCCSNLTLRRSCTTHTSAMVYGVKVRAHHHVVSRRTTTNTTPRHHANTHA